MFESFISNTDLMNCTGGLLTKKVWMYDTGKSAVAKHSDLTVVGKKNSAQNSCYEVLIASDDK
jgi:hypothetical protein